MTSDALRAMWKTLLPEERVAACAMVMQTIPPNQRDEAWADLQRRTRRHALANGLTEADGDRIYQRFRADIEERISIAR